MKVLQIPFCFYPDPVGGTEVYVEGLSKCLQELGIQNVIVAPANKNARYLHNGLSVRRFAISSKINDLRELYNEGDPTSALEFGRLLDEEKPNLVHLHAFTRGCSFLLVGEAKKRDIPVIFTYHTPTVSCQRGTLMRWGKQVCEGVLNVGTCTSCTLHGLGLPKGIADVFALTPLSIGHILEIFKLSGGFWTALRMRELMNLRHRVFQAFISSVNHIIVLCQWSKELLLHNGVSIDKISLLRHSIFYNGIDNDEKSHSGRPSEYLKIAFIGRLDRTKGVDIVIKSIRKLPGLPIQFHIYGVVQDERNDTYLEKLKGLAINDSRIIFMPIILNEQVPSILKNYDLLVIPSRGLETGPLVILEAFAAGVPVIGSNLGGIAEMVQHNVNGLLVEPDSIEAWCRELQRLCEDRDLVLRLRSGIRAPRKMDALAREMEVIYTQLLYRHNSLYQ